MLHTQRPPCSKESVVFTANASGCGCEGIEADSWSAGIGMLVSNKEGSHLHNALNEVVTTLNPLTQRGQTIEKFQIEFVSLGRLPSGQALDLLDSKC